MICYIPCPHCREEIEVTLIEWPGDPPDVRIDHQDCECEIDPDELLDVARETVRMWWEEDMDAKRKERD